jgi:hypothetical protein
MYLVNIRRFNDDTLTTFDTETKVFRHVGDAVSSFVFSWHKVGPVGLRNDTGEVYIQPEGQPVTVIGKIEPVRVVECAMRL